jgi:hypothetical protein
MQAVIVNGTVVVRDDKVLPVYPGKPIRFEKTEPKFEPLSAEKWVEQFLGAVEVPGEGGMPHPDTHPEHFKNDGK